MKQKTRDNLIYLGVALAIVAASSGYLIYSLKTAGEIPELSVPILWGIFSTPLIVALILEHFWEHRRRRALWLVLSFVATINIVAVSIAYAWRWNPPLLVWTTVTGLWLVVVFVLTEKFLSWDRKSSR